MERKEALKRLRRLLGDKVGYRVRPDAPSAEEREEARQRHATLVEQRNAASRAMNERQRVLLQDAEYQRLRQEYKHAEKTVHENNSTMHLYKFTVGTSGDLFFHVKAEGDSWEEIFAKLKQ